MRLLISERPGKPKPPPRGRISTRFVLVCKILVKAMFSEDNTTSCSQPVLARSQRGIISMSQQKGLNRSGASRNKITPRRNGSRGKKNRYRLPLRPFRGPLGFASWSRGGG